MDTKNSLVRFLDAQNQDYLKALSEIRNARKISHWMWYIFPQLKGLGQSETAKFYGIRDIEEAESYLAHPVLARHLIEISTALMQIEGKSATEIFGRPDDVKLRSCMTLFANVANSDPVFEKVLQKYFHGTHDEYTLELLVRYKLKNDTV